MVSSATSYVYVIFRPNGEPCYVGKGKGGRWRQHIRNSHNRRLQRIFAKAGGDLPIIKVRERLTDAAAIETEIAFIAAIGRADLGTGPLVNMTGGGEGTAGYVQPPEVRRKHSVSLRGIKRSDETRRAIKAAKTGKKLSAEALQARRSKMDMAALSKAISDALKGRPLSPEHRAAIAAGNVGRIMSQEAREKIAAFRRGKPLSEAHREACRAGWRRRKERLAAEGARSNDNGQ